MKKRNLFGLLMLFAFLGFTACSEDNTEDQGELLPEEELAPIVATYVDKVVVPTYADMKAKVTALKTSVDKYVSDGTQASLDAACTAWRAAREPWELSEAFLFGPADFENLDPSLDSWPLDKDIIDQILDKGDFSEIEGEDEKKAEIRGFHTLEYLLFEDGNPKTIAGITTAQKNYMAAVVRILLEDTEALYNAWAVAYENGNSYGEKFKSGNAGESIKSMHGAVAQIVDGCMDIANEVGSAKIGDPYEEYKTNQELGVLKVESWYSWNSLDDYYNNIVSIENSYMGGTIGNRDAATSLSTLVKKYDEALDEEIKNAIDNAKKAIRGIPAPFRSNLDKKTEIENAQLVLDNLETTLLKIKRALVLN